MITYVRKKPDRLKGWSILVILLILGSIFAQFEMGLGVKVGLQIIDVDIGVVGLTLFMDIIHCIHLMIIHHRRKKAYPFDV